MKVSFPHMGSLYLPLQALFTRLEWEYIIPPGSGEKALEIGKSLSPENVCLPYKINMGNYVEAVKLGADTIVMAGANGPCRFGLYGRLQKTGLQEEFRNVKMLVLDQDNLASVLKELSRIGGRRSMLTVLGAFRHAWKTLNLVELHEKVCSSARARARSRVMVDRIEKLVNAEIARFAREESGSLKEHALRNMIFETYNSLEKTEEECLKVGFVGEIYMNLDDRANMDVRRRLGCLGVEVVSTVTLSGWLKKLVHLDLSGPFSTRRLKKLARPYIQREIGGKAVHTIGAAVALAEYGVDGIIHIFPFGCMPEVVAGSILPKICEERSIPLLTVVLDEHSSPAGLQTRLEAFVEMIRFRKAEKV